MVKKETKWKKIISLIPPSNIELKKLGKSRCPSGSSYLNMKRNHEMKNNKQVFYDKKTNRMKTNFPYISLFIPPSNKSWKARKVPVSLIKTPEELKSSGRVGPSSVPTLLFFGKNNFTCKKRKRRENRALRDNENEEWNTSFI